MAKVKKLVKVDDRTQLFLIIIGNLHGFSDEGLRDLAFDAGCHWGTLYAWKSGNTTHPRIDTLVKVAKVLGYEIALKRTKAVKLRIVK